MKQTKKNATATQGAIAAQPTTTHAKPLANTSKHGKRSPFANVTMRPTVMLTPDALSLIQLRARQQHTTPGKYLAYLMEVNLIATVRRWEKQNPEEYAAAQESFWQRVDNWRSNNGSTRRAD